MPGVPEMQSVVRPLLLALSCVEPPCCQEPVEAHIESGPHTNSIRDYRL